MKPIQNLWPEDLGVLTWSSAKWIRERLQIHLLNLKYHPNDKWTQQNVSRLKNLARELKRTGRVRLV